MKLADYAASYVDKNTAVLSLCPGRTKTTQALLSCCCALDAVSLDDSGYNDVHLRPSSAARLTSLLRYRLTVNGTCRLVKAAARDGSVGTCRFGYTAIFVFFMSVSPEFTLLSLYDSGSNSFLLRHVLDRG